MEEDLVYLMNLHYMYYQIYLYQVLIVQKNVRMYLEKKRYYRLQHMNKNRDVLRDIIEVSYLPPIRDNLKILEKGGYNYRESCKSFNRLRLTDII